MALFRVICLLVTLLKVNAINGPPIVGYFELTPDNREYPSAFTMYKNSHIELKLSCTTPQTQISWVLRKYDCLSVQQKPSEDLCDVKTPEERKEYNSSTYFSQEQACPDVEHGGDLKDESCNILRQFLDQKDVPDYCNNTAVTAVKSVEKRSSPDANVPPEMSGANTESLKPGDTGSDKQVAPDASKTTTKASKSDSQHLYRIAVAWDDGIYELSLCGLGESFKGTLMIKNKQEQYLSAADWPLLPFFGVMCGIYIILGLVWLVLMMLHWKDLLRLQFWIGCVILLGMVEKAVFVYEYEHLNIHGTSVKGALVFAEMVSCLKRTLARILVIIVSLGFGIIKPRLGPMFSRVVAIGVIYFVLALVERCTVIYGVIADFKVSLFIVVPLSVCDALICWWIFTSLITTMRTLKLRRNVVKLSVYRHFTNILIFAVLASLVFMVWSTLEHKMPLCIYDWQELWVDDAVWHLLFSIILVVIAILWRPSANSQQYAYSPLLDQDDEESTEPMMLNDAFEGMKMRGGGGNKEPRNKVDDSLKWAEDNIPTSIVDNALPSLLDSDEEVMTTKFEMSKMD